MATKIYDLSTKIFALVPSWLLIEEVNLEPYNLEPYKDDLQ